MLDRKGWLVGVVSLASLCALARCVGDSSTPADGGDDATTPDAANDVSTQPDTSNDGGPADDADAAAASAHVYAVSFGAGAQAALVVFDVPLTDASTPVAVLTAGFKTPSDVEITSANGSAQLVVIDPGVQKVFFFDTPVNASSTPAFAFSSSIAPFDGVFDSKGNLWMVGTAGAGVRFAPPYSAGSTPAQTFTVPNATFGSFAIGVNKLDGIFVGSTASNDTGHVYGQTTPFDAGFAPTLDNTHVDTPTGIVVGNSAVFISDQIHGVIDEFATPMLSSEAPTAVGASALAAPTRLVINANGNLVVADATKGIVILQGPLFDTAAVTVPSSFGDAAATTFDFRSVVIGP